MKKLLTVCAVAMMVFGTSVAYALPSDSFDDNAMGPLWTLLEDDHDNAWLDETNARLEMHSTASAADLDALYIANDWGLLPTGDFSLKVDFHHAYPVNSSESSVLLGIGKDFDNFMLFEAGYDGASYFWYEKVTGGSSVGGGKVRTLNDGTLYISYNATTDDLYLSDTGYWSGAAWVTLPGLLQGEWSGDAVGPFLGGWSEYMTLDTGDAHLDDFVVESGTFVPEPATIILLGFGGLTLLRKKRRA